MTKPLQHPQDYLYMWKMEVTKSCLPNGAISESSETMCVGSSVKTEHHTGWIRKQKSAWPPPLTSGAAGTPLPGTVQSSGSLSREATIWLKSSEKLIVRSLRTRRKEVSTKAYGFANCSAWLLLNWPAGQTDKLGRGQFFSGFNFPFRGNAFSWYPNTPE